MVLRLSASASSAVVVSALLCAACGVDLRATEEAGPTEVEKPDQWFPMNDAANLGRDISGNARHGLAVALSAVTDASRGQVARFADSALVFVPVMKQDFTISLWVKTEQLGPAGDFWSDGPRIFNGDISGVHLDFSLALLLDKAALGAGMPDDSDADKLALKSARSVVDGAWHHLAITRDGERGLWSLFVDGELDTSRSGATGPLVLPDSVSFGVLGETDPKTPPLEADLSDARLYSRALSAEAVAFLATR